MESHVAIALDTIVKYVESLTEMDRLNLRAVVSFGKEKAAKLLKAAKATGNEDKVMFATMAMLLASVEPK